jgi:hypothetical protein
MNPGPPGAPRVTRPQKSSGLGGIGEATGPLPSAMPKAGPGGALTVRE